MALVVKQDTKPRGRMTAYAFFVKICREEHKKKHPEENVVFAEFSKKCAERWKTMGDKEKSRFHEMADKDKKRYDTEMLSYSACTKESAEENEEESEEGTDDEPVMALDAVTEALKNIARDDSSNEKELNYFCVENSFLTKDINVSVEDVGNISFPIDENCVKKLIDISSKAVFGRGEKTVLDTNVRDTQTIPASKLKVDINEESLAVVLERIGIGLNIDKNCTLVPHLYNMLIYGPGQFFDRHRDSEKIPKMVATLVVVLPSPHKGGDLIIEHNDKKHMFFGSQTSEIVKCIAFYSDCRHEIKKVTEGYRVALTFNVVLNSPNIYQTVKLDECLKRAVRDYFRGEDHPKRLIFYMNHSYSKCSLKWSLLKGSDRSRGHALYVVAAKLGLKPCLALIEHQESYQVMPYHCEDELSETSTEPYFWVSWHDKEFIPHPYFSGNFDEDEVCYTIETSELLEPYRTEKDEGEPYGNSPETEDRWYRRACVVLLRWQEKTHKKHKKNLPNQVNEGETSKSTSQCLINQANGSKETIVDQTNKGKASTETNCGQASEPRVLQETSCTDIEVGNFTVPPSQFYGKR